MTKAEFLQVFERSLTGWPQVKGEIIGDYEENVRMGLAAGKSEEEISAALGDPKRSPRPTTRISSSRRPGRKSPPAISSAPPSP